MRLFVALWPPPDVAQTLETAIATAAGTAGPASAGADGSGQPPAIRWSRTQQRAAPPTTR